MSRERNGDGSRCIIAQIKSVWARIPMFTLRLQPSRNVGAHMTDTIISLSEPEYKTTSFPNWAKGLGVLAIGVGWFVLAAIASLATMALVDEVMRNIATAAVKSAVHDFMEAFAFAGWLIIAALLMMRPARTTAPSAALTHRRHRYWLLAGIVAVTIPWVFFEVYIGLHVPHGQGQGSDTSVSAALAALIGAIVLAPVCEELFFRQAMWTRLQPYWGTLGMAVATTAWWMALHLSRGPLMTMMILPSAILFCVARHYCGSVRAAMVAHAATNLTVFIAVFVYNGLGWWT